MKWSRHFTSNSSAIFPRCKQLSTESFRELALLGFTGKIGESIRWAKICFEEEYGPNVRT